VAGVRRVEAAAKKPQLHLAWGGQWRAGGAGRA
jgi:hypothetical protein